MIIPVIPAVWRASVAFGCSDVWFGVVYVCIWSAGFGRVSGMMFGMENVKRDIG